MTMGQLPFQGPREGRPDMIMVGTGDNRRVEAQVTITSPGGQTKLRTHPSGITVTLVLNTFGIARTVREVLASRPRLRQAEQTKRRSPVGGPTGRDDRAGPLSPPPGASRPAAGASPVR